MSKEAEKLLPCPFCGSHDIDAEGWTNSDGVTGPACNVCSASAGTIKGVDNIAAWNRRSNLAVGLEIKPLEWKGPDQNTAYGEQGAFVYTVMAPNRTPGWRVWVHLRSVSGLSASVGGVIITVKAESIEAAIAAAEADYRQRILSTLSLPAQEPVQPDEAPLIMRLVAAGNAMVGWADLSKPGAQAEWMKWRDVSTEALKLSTTALKEA